MFGNSAWEFPRDNRTSLRFETRVQFPGKGGQGQDTYKIMEVRNEENPVHRGTALRISIPYLKERNYFGNLSPARSFDWRPSQGFTDQPLANNSPNPSCLRARPGWELVQRLEGPCDGKWGNAEMRKSSYSICTALHWVFYLFNCNHSW